MDKYFVFLFMPFPMAGTPITKGGMNGFYPWADKRKKAKKKPKTLTSSHLLNSASPIHGHKVFF
ncbi:MAG TPA: hypothetical protein ENJ53_01035 [Phaeodactylibacter sp.]|nr:hypothetical protein [Phaeodactylibacter sp.]